MAYYLLVLRFNNVGCTRMQQRQLPLYMGSELIVATWRKSINPWSNIRSWEPELDIIYNCTVLTPVIYKADSSFIMARFCISCGMLLRTI